MRARVVRTKGGGGSASLHRRMQWCCHHTLCHIDVGPRKPIGSEKTGVHVDAVLNGDAPLARPHSLDSQRRALTESSTPPSALSSPSTLSFLRWSSAMVSWVACPFATGAVVGPEGMVGAWRLLMILRIAASPFLTRSGP